METHRAHSGLAYHVLPGWPGGLAVGHLPVITLKKDATKGKWKRGASAPVKTDKPFYGEVISNSIAPSPIQSVTPSSVQVL